MANVLIHGIISVVLLTNPRVEWCFITSDAGRRESLQGCLCDSGTPKENSCTIHEVTYRND
jgi:hypothetical protein